MNERSRIYAAVKRGVPPAHDVNANGHVEPTELFVRHAKRDGRAVAMLKAVDYGDSCVVEAEVFPVDARTAAPVQPGPYTFADPQQATAFVTEVVEALMYLGCDVQAE